MASLEVLYDLPEVSERTGYTEACINSWVKDGKFPQPIKAARGKSGRFRKYWKKSDVDRYMEVIKKKEEAITKRTELINENMLRELENMELENDKLEEEIKPKLEVVKRWE